MSRSKLTVSILPEHLAICRLDAGASVPVWAEQGTFVSVTRTREELTVICPEERIAPEIEASRNWRAFQLQGPFDLNLVGLLVSVAAPLAQAGVSILPIGTYDTDYVLVRQTQLEAAIRALTFIGIEVQEAA
jgi:uncharacterized protein